MNEQLQLYKLLCTKDNSLNAVIIDELGWVDEDKFFVWVPYLFLEDFVKALKDTFSNNIFDDNSITARMLESSVCFDLTQVLEEFLDKEDFEAIFPKDKYQH